ncbi:RDD family protein [Cutibacterium equinum]|uniref:RDD family protein n=1 Tax=Cutibacterium equinum TaxID=3016342 RepID=A0ABY7QXH2_9ACTN|nr:RDD family protein [Cutibacterium equinum]WCC79753.1 RDD family protein [Cutibacterium equinum]
MTSQQLILGLIAIAILIVLAIPTLIVKTRKEHKSSSPTGSAGESRPATRGQRFGALLVDVMFVFALNGIGWGLFTGGTALYELSDITRTTAIESAIHPIGTALLLAINIGYVIVSAAGRFGFSPGTNAMHLAWVDADGRPSGRVHTLVIGAAFILSVFGKTSVGMFASIGIVILFLEAVSLLWDERGIIAKIMHLHLVDAKATTARAQ